MIFRLSIARANSTRCWLAKLRGSIAPLIAIQLLGSLQALSQPRDGIVGLACASYFESPGTVWALSPTAIRKLSVVPEIKSLVLDVLADPAVPASVKLILQSGLEREDVSIVRFTAELQSASGLRGRFTALHAHRRDFVRHDLVTQFDLSLNAQGTTQANSLPDDNEFLRAITTNHTLFLQGRAPTAEQNDLVQLVHELAHVKFTVFFDRDLERLSRLFPNYVVRTASGRFQVEEAFHAYLYERHAFETEYRLVRGAGDRHFPRLRRFAPDVIAGGDAHAIPLIAAFVRNTYRLADPRLAAFDRIPLSDLLLNGP